MKHLKLPFGVGAGTQQAFEGLKSTKINWNGFCNFLQNPFQGNYEAFEASLWGWVPAPAPFGPKWTLWTQMGSIASLWGWGWDPTWKSMVSEGLPRNPIG